MRHSPVAVVSLLFLMPILLQAEEPTINVPAAPLTAPLVISVGGLRSSSGYIAINVFAKSPDSGYPADAKKAAAERYVQLNGERSLVIKVEGLAAGSYAVAVMHDEDGDRKLKTTLFGIPREGFGFSNNPTVYFGPPSFSKAQISKTESETSIDIRMKYLL